MSFDDAIRILPLRFQVPLRELEPRLREVRLRCHQPPQCVLDTSTRPLGAEPVTPRELTSIIDLATGGSTHTAGETLRQGFLPLPGGHRLGICGRAVVRDRELSHFREVSSLSLRIAHDVKGIAGPLMPELWERGRFKSCLILSPPGLGKTTLLRDIIRCISTDSDGFQPWRVGLADERGEVAACYNGVPQLDIGTHVDIISGCTKSDAMMLLLRAHSPQVLAVDEITAAQDVEALAQASYCGVSLLATAHCSSVADLHRRPLYRGLPEIFDRFVLIEGNPRRFRVEMPPLRRDES